MVSGFLFDILRGFVMIYSWGEDNPNPIAGTVRIILAIIVVTICLCLGVVICPAVFLVGKLRDLAVHLSGYQTVEKAKDIRRTREHTKIFIVELKPFRPTFGKFLRYPTYGTLLLGTILRLRGWDVEVLVEGVSNWKRNELLTANAVCFSVHTPAANKTRRLSKWLRENGVWVVWGGPHVTFFPEDSLKSADVALVGEGDESLPALLDLQFRSDCESYTADEVPGMCFVNRLGQIVHSQKRCPRSIDVPVDYSVLRMSRKLTAVPVQASRGCDRHCAFCVTGALFGPAIRRRPIATVIEEVRRAAWLAEDKIPVSFVDNHFGGGLRQQVLELCQELIQLQTEEAFSTSVFITLDKASDPEILDQMWSSGVRTVAVGLESLSPGNLEDYRKRGQNSTAEESIKLLRNRGFKVVASIVVGGETDTVEVIETTIETCIRWGVTWLAPFALSPYRNMEHLVPNNRVILPSWDIASGSLLYYFSKSDRASRLQRAVADGLVRFYSLRRMFESLLAGEYEIAWGLFLRRLAVTPVVWDQRRHARKLEKLESGLYDDHNHLIESALKERGVPPAPWDIPEVIRPDVVEMMMPACPGFM